MLLVAFLSQVVSERFQVLFYGIILLQIITYGFVFLGIDSAWQIVIKGSLIITAVALDTRKYLK